MRHQRPPDRRHHSDRYVPSQHIHLRGYGDGHVDQVAVTRCLAEQLVPLRPAELALAIDALDAEGLSSKQIARRLGCSDRTVTRRRARRRLEGSTA